MDVQVPDPTEEQRPTLQTCRGPVGDISASRVVKGPFPDTVGAYAGRGA